MSASDVDAFLGLLRGLSSGHLTIRDDRGGEYSFGDVASGPSARVIIHDESLYSRLLRDGELGLGQSYVDGWWDEADDRLVDLFAIILQNQLDKKFRGALGVKVRVIRHHLSTLATRSRSRQNITSHYDLGNDFFQLFLDPTLAYSCGYQRQPNDSLSQMQLQKYELVCRKLQLRRGDRLLDIGSGWGGLLLYAAKRFGVEGVGVTISPQQHAWSQRRLEEEGLQEQLEFRVQDYRDVDGSFDKVVSVGMFEHVGREYQRQFFAKLHQVLRPEGAALLHTMATPRGGLPSEWLRRHVFPGTYLPSLADLARRIYLSGDTVVHVENLKPHYAETARLWSRRFEENRNAVLSLGPPYDEKFVRLWNYYLQFLEASFRHGTLQVYQVLMSKGTAWSMPMQLDFQNSTLGDSDFAYATSHSRHEDLR